MEYGSPEYQVYCAIPPEGISYTKLINKLGNVGKHGYDYGLKYDWFRFDKEHYRIFRNKTIEVDEICESIKNIKEGFIPVDKKLIKKLKERQYVISN